MENLIEIDMKFDYCTSLIIIEMNKIIVNVKYTLNLL